MKNFQLPPLSFLPFLFFAALCLTSCGDIQQDIKLNLNGSGQIETSFDLGEVMSMMKGLGDMNTQDVTISDSDADHKKDKKKNKDKEKGKDKTESGKDPMQAIVDRVTDPEYDRDFDTTIAMLNIMPDSIKRQVKRKDLADHVSIHMVSPKKSSDLTVGALIKFDNETQLKDIINFMDTLQASESAMMQGSGGFPKETFLTFHADMKAGKITIPDTDFSGMDGEMSMGGMAGDTSQDNQQMMQMMFGNTKIKTTIHVPGEVISCSNKDAVITKDNRVLVEHDFIQVIKSKILPGYTIQFKPGKS